MPADQQRRHFGVLSFTGTGHLNSFLSLSQQLKDRGHRVTFFDKPKIEQRVLQAGLEFFSVFQKTTTFQKEPPPTGRGVWSEISMLRFNLRRIIQDLNSFLEKTPAALTNAGVDALIINEIALTGPTVAQMLRLPYFIISTSVPHNFGWGGYPWFSGYRYSSSWFSWVQNAYLENSTLRIRGPIRNALDDYRRQFGLDPFAKLLESYPPLAHITQLPRCLDLPRKNLPSGFFYTGPFSRESATRPVEFPWDRLDGRTVVYASLGTTRNVQPWIYRLIAEACEGLDVQLVISLGGRFDTQSFADLAGRPLVVKYAPQLELLKVAKIVITHACLNTVFETLLQGLPMIAIPLAHDQPAIAARLDRLNVAEVLPVMRLSVKRIRNALIKLLTNPAYRDAAVSLKSTIRATHGAECAAEVIEAALDRYSAPAWRSVRDPIIGPASDGSAFQYHRRG